MNYKCGCTADGDNVASYCPIHGEANVATVDQENEILNAEKTLDMLRYFWEEKGDIERWTGFDRAAIAKEYPEVLKAWDDYNTARRLLTAVLRGVSA